MSEHDEPKTTCARCGYGVPNPHDLTDTERRLAEHFLSEVYAGHGDERHRSLAPCPVDEMLREDPHYFLCQNAIRDARRLLLAFPHLADVLLAEGYTTSPAPEATETVEWGVDFGYADGHVARARNEVAARRTATTYGGTAVSRRGGGPWVPVDRAADQYEEGP